MPLMLHHRQVTVGSVEGGCVRAYFHFQDLSVVRMILYSFDREAKEAADHCSQGMRVRVGTRRRIEAGDEAFRAMSEAWSRALRDGFTQISL